MLGFNEYEVIYNLKYGGQVLELYTKSKTKQKTL